MKNEIRKSIPLDPDPVSIAFGILGAVGSIASILGYLNQVSDRKDAKETLNRYLLSELIETATAIETSIISIRSNYESIKLIIESNIEFSPDIEEKSSVFIFGSQPLFLSTRDYNKFSKCHLQITQDSKVLIKNMYSIVKNLYRHHIDISNLTYEKLIALQGKMNKLISNRLEYNEALNFYSSLLEDASNLTNDLKNEFMPGYGGEPSKSIRAGNG